MNENHNVSLGKKSQPSNKKIFASGNPRLQNLMQKNSPQLNTAEDPRCFQETCNDNPFLITVQKKLIGELNASQIQRITNQEEIRSMVDEVLQSLSEREFPTLTNKEKTSIVQALVDEFNGLGPLQKLMLDDSISEIMVNGFNQIFIERKGTIEVTELKFRDNEHIIQTIEKIIFPLGRRIDESSPMVDARLPDGSRVNAIIPPVSLKGPVLTIRKFTKDPLTIEMLVNYGSLSEDMAAFLEIAVKSRLNIIVAGGTGSGKTTFLNVLSALIPGEERIITIEDAAELQLLQPHVISLESRPPNIEEKGAISIRDLLRNTLRMRPDRIIIGEVRGAESLDMLQAMNTGHNGSLSTVHANSPRDVLSRLETMVLYSGINFPLRAVREQIASALDLIIYTERFSDGSRKVTRITEVTGMESDIVVLQDIFVYKKTGLLNGKPRGEFNNMSIRPRVFDKFDTIPSFANGWE